MPSFGHLKEYQEHLVFYFMANGFIDNEKKKVFFNVCEASLYSYYVLCTLCMPDTPKMVGTDDIPEKLNNQHFPKHSEILCCFEFNKRNQQQKETIWLI